MPDLTTLERVRAWLKPGSSNLGTADDALLGDLISSASAMVLGHLNRTTLGVEDYSEFYDTAAVNFVTLRQSPVVSVTSLVIIGQQTFTEPCDPASPRPGQLLVDRQRLVLVGGRFPAGRSTIQVNYSAGYATVPEDIQQIVVELVGERFKSRDRIGVRSKSLPNGESVTFDRSALSLMAIQVLQPYVRVV